MWRQSGLILFNCFSSHSNPCVSFRRHVFWAKLFTHMSIVSSKHLEHLQECSWSFSCCVNNFLHLHYACFFEMMLAIFSKFFCRRHCTTLVEHTITLASLPWRLNTTRKFWPLAKRITPFQRFHTRIKMLQRRRRQDTAIFVEKQLTICIWYIRKAVHLILLGRSWKIMLCYEIFHVYMYSWIYSF